MLRYSGLLHRIVPVRIGYAPDARLPIPHLEVVHVVYGNDDMVFHLLGIPL